MSAYGDTRAITPPDIRSRKGGTPLVCLTAYTTPVARLVDPHCDVVLVGDSVGMVLHGLPSTLGVTLEMMITHGQAVRRGIKQALMVVDLPFGSYEESPEQAFRNAARVMAETGCTAGGLAQATYELFAGMIEFGLAKDLTRIVTVTDTRMERILRLATWPLSRIGEPKCVGKTEAVAGFLEISHASLLRIRSRGRLSGPVLWQPVLGPSA